MSKHFMKFPFGLDEYNPPKLNGKDFTKNETLDKNEKYHSFNDKPSLITKSNLYMDSEEFYWHSHGKLYRKGNRAPIIFSSPTFYITNDENSNLHSYEGKPAYLCSIKDKNEDALLLKWYSAGKLHRNDDFPALLAITDGEFSEEIFYKNDVLHRGNGLPAQHESTFTAWVVEGGVHNISKPAILKRSLDQLHLGSQWGLYGVSITESVFDATISYHVKRQVPLWVAFLHTLNIITTADISNFANIFNNWDTQLPLEWLLRAWGVTDEKFKKHVELLVSDPRDMFYEKPSLGLFIKIINSDANYAALQKGKLNNV
jgi:hypothetical protein